MPLRLLLVLCLSIGMTIAASPPVRAGDAYVYSVHGAAIDGYDVVAYFVSGEPVRGQSSHRVKWRGAIWYFSSAQNQDRFERNPKAYAPRYGGYCAFAMASGHTMSTDPFSWRIVDGRLYLLHNAEAARLWEDDIQQHVASANLHWAESLKK